jgi:transglutaminase-like putative cysteine protease
MYLSITHVTEYCYSSPAFDSFNEIKLRPADDYRQTMLAFGLEVEPEAVVRDHRDYYGNVAHHFHLPFEHNRLRIKATSRVVTYPTPYPQPVSAWVLPELRHRFFEYLAPTRRINLNHDWFEAFGALRLGAGDDLVAYLVALTRYLQTRFTYQPDSTQVDTPLETFAETHTGVCQDYAHAMLAICRSAEIPCRYVSGYVHANPFGDETLLGAEGSHAWVEAFLPGSGWVGFDPTNGCLVNEAHVKIGVGRDYDDVPPVAGLRRGGGESTLTVTVQVRHG